MPRFLVWNKIDRLDAPLEPDELKRAAGGHPYTTLTSRDVAAVADFERALLDAVRREDDEMVTVVPYERSEILHLVWGQCRVLESDATSEDFGFRVKGPRTVLAKIRNGVERAQ